MTIYRLANILGANYGSCYSWAKDKRKVSAAYKEKLKEKFSKEFAEFVKMKKHQKTN